MVDFKKPDSQTQIINLQNILKTPNATKEDVVLAMLLSIMIFFRNRPGRLKDYKPYFIHGTGCHNPTSEKTGKTVWGIWRYEITIVSTEKSRLEIKYEYKNPGYLKAVFKSGKKKRIVTGDISIHRKLFKKERTVKIASATCSQPDLLMRDLNKFLKDPLDELLRVINEIRKPVL